MNLSATLRAYYTYETLDNQYNVGVTYSNSTINNGYTYSSDPYCRHEIIVGMGLTADINEDTIIYVDYNAHIIPNATKDLNHNINAGIKIFF